VLCKLLQGIRVVNLDVQYVEHCVPSFSKVLHYRRYIVTVLCPVVGRPEGKRPLGRPRRKWEDNIKMDSRDIGIDGANWIWLAQDRVQW
jgi:hypothetical protein